MNIKENLKLINNQLSLYKSKYNNPNVKIIAVSKFHPVEEIQEAIDCGQIVFGENRVQEACLKFKVLKDLGIDFTLHFIGQLQTNKVKNIIPICSCIQSVDRITLIQEIQKQCKKINKKMDILLEVHTGEESKSGFLNEDEIFYALDYIKNNKLEYVNPIGFMTMAPFTNDESLITKSFSTLRKIKEKAQELYPNFNLTQLSMGMSSDFELAIKEGATMVRIGTSIFGERKY